MIQVTADHGRKGSAGSALLPAIAWAAKADVINRYLEEGSKITVQGRLEIDSYKDKNGNPVSTVGTFSEGRTALLQLTPGSCCIRALLLKQTNRHKNRQGFPALSVLLCIDKPTD